MSAADGAAVRLEYLLEEVARLEYLLEGRRPGWNTCQRGGGLVGVPAGGRRPGRSTCWRAAARPEYLLEGGGPTEVPARGRRPGRKICQGVAAWPGLASFFCGVCLFLQIYLIIFVNFVIIQVCYKINKQAVLL